MPLCKQQQQQQQTMGNDERASRCPPSPPLIIVSWLWWANWAATALNCCRLANPCAGGFFGRSSPPPPPPRTARAARSLLVGTGRWSINSSPCETGREREVIDQRPTPRRRLGWEWTLPSETGRAVSTCFASPSYPVSRCGSALARQVSCKKDLGSIRFGFPFSSLQKWWFMDTGLVTLPTQIMKH